MTQDSLFPMSEKEKVSSFAAELLLEKCARTKSVILTDEGRVLTVTPTRKKTICQTMPEWVHPVTNIHEAKRIIARSFELRNR